MNSGFDADFAIPGKEYIPTHSIQGNSDRVQNYYQKNNFQTLVGEENNCD